VSTASSATNDSERPRLASFGTRSLGLRAVPFLLVATLADCGSGNTKVPAARIDCGKAAYRQWQLNGGVAPSIGYLDLEATQLEHVGTSREAITNPPENGGVITPPRISDIGRAVVRIVRLRNGAVVGSSTGTIIGRHTVLTAAHTLRSDTPYDSVQVLVVDGDTGAWVDGRPIRYFVDPDYDPVIENTATHVPNDLALIEVAIDFVETQEITPIQVGSEYLPQRDSCDCPDEVLSIWGYGRGNRGGDPYIRGATVTPLDSDADIQESSIMTFVPIADPGDSGGPVLRFDESRQQYVQVAVNSGDVLTGDGQTRLATAVLNEDRLAPLLTMAESWRLQNQRVFGAPQYPPPDANLPNGTVNQASIVYPVTGAAGRATPIAGNPAAGQNGYFVFPLVPEPARQPFPGPGGGQCG